MTVYVDHVRVPFGRMRMSHMMADTTAELLSIVARLGLRPEWIQQRGTPREHFDVCEAVRARALALPSANVVAASARQIVTLMRMKEDVAS